MGPFERSFHFLARRRGILPVALAVLLGLAVAGAVQVSLAEDIFALLPADEPRVAETRLALDRYRGLERIVIALEADSEGTLAAAVDEADESLRKLHGVKSVVSRVDRAAQEDFFNEYAGKAPLLFDADLERQLAPRLNRAYFAGQLQRYLDEQAGSEGISVASRFRQDPFGLDELVYQRVAHLNGGFRGRIDGKGRILSDDGRFAVLFVEADFASSDTGRGREFMEELAQALPGNVTCHVIGAHRSSVDNAVVLRRDMHLTIATSIVAITLLFLVVFRSLTPIVLPLLSVGFGFLMALGAQGWLRGELSAITMGFSAVLLGIAVDYSIHLIATFGSESGERPERARAAIAHVGRPAFVAALTTIAAVFMLRFSNFDGLHQLAEMAIAGIAGALVFALLAGPQLLRVAGPKARAAHALRSALQVVSAWRRAVGRGMIVIPLLLTIGLFMFARNVAFDGDVMNLDGKSAQTRESETLVQQAFGQETLSRTLLVSGGDNLEAALRENDLNARVLQRVNIPHEGLSWVLPARSTQRENLARWRSFWSDTRIGSLKTEMAAARAKRPDTGDEIGFSEDMIEQRFAELFAAVRVATPPAELDAGSLKKKPMWALLSSYVSEGERTYVGSTATLEPARVPELRAAATSAIVLNKGGFVARMVQFIQGDLLLMGGLSLTLVVLVLALTFRSARDVLIALVPVAGGMIWTLGLMSLLGISFNIINTLVTVFIAGLGIDYGIFFVQTWRGSKDAPEADRRLSHAGAGVVVAALTTLFGFGSLALANHPALFSVGVTTAIGVSSALLLTLFVVPTLLEMTAPKKPEPDAPARATRDTAVSPEAGNDEA
ncbi:MAG: MMPL family transporter [Planctomycetes bacterium]|nr:MMPL family transporter [Planctomycetota bacterium]MCW8134273.1 MMPL family transporter [Planctomycetota bacterium]